MLPISKDSLEKRRSAIQASFDRQLSLAGKPGYDPLLTENLKKDLDWLQEEINRINIPSDPQER
ncbi:MAG TPA: hypothetical protein VK772_04890 [Puia sp.]|nr:hypothetical protein [Puia sp.]